LAIDLLLLLSGAESTAAVDAGVTPEEPNPREFANRLVP